jgi:acyl-[acyl-carrier-protein]-phospholipid O-acyltransferase/long-chain-fatty-acid--[acyl-carrier-protein] ligase
MRLFSFLQRIICIPVGNAKNELNKLMSELSEVTTAIDMPGADGSFAPFHEDGRLGVGSQGFLALVITQFFVSLNDNMFRWLIVPIGIEMIQPPARALSLGLACFTLPFLIFAAPAGFFADRFSKRNVIVTSKVAEIVILILGIASIHIGNVYLMFLTVFLLGTQAAIFATSKLGAIPEIVRGDQLSLANGIISMASMVAIILGTLAGNILYDQTKPGGRENWWISAAALLGVAVSGWVSSLFICPLRSANPQRRIPWNPAEQTLRDLGVLKANPALLLATLGSAYFWTLGALSQINIDTFAKMEVGVTTQSYVGPLLGILTLGIGFGAVLAGIWSQGKVELGLVPTGAFGIAVACILLTTVPTGAVGHPNMLGYGCTCFWLLALGMAAGLYDVPLQAFIQDRSDPKSRGSVMAAYNFMAFAGMFLASGIFWLLTDWLGLSARMVFLIGGLTTLFVAFYIAWLVPFHTARFFSWLITRCMYRVKLEGLENVPAGGALVVSNHVSWADGVLLGLACPRHPRMVAYADYFAHPLLSWYGRLGKIIPIGETRKSMVESIRQAREALQNGEIVCIFAEGGITRTGEMQEFRPGFLSILKGTDAPVVPVYLGGLWGSIFSYEGGKFFWKWPKRWRYPVSIRFGEPISKPTDVEQVRRAIIAMQEQYIDLSNTKKNESK